MSELIKKEMWFAKYGNNRRGNTAICRKCNGSPTNRCWCKKQKFYDSITDEDIRQYLEKKRIKEIESIKKDLENKKKEIKQLEDRLVNLTHCK